MYDTFSTNVNQTPYHDGIKCVTMQIDRQISNISRTLAGNKIVEWNCCRRCSNYIFILDLAIGFNGVGRNN